MPLVANASVYGESDFEQALEAIIEAQAELEAFFVVNMTPTICVEAQLARSQRPRPEMK
jgi:hypothetical protein